MKFLDLTREYRNLSEKIRKGIFSVFSRGEFILGNEVEKFEEGFARYCGVRYAIGVGSGTDALYLALKALGIGRGDRVLTVSNTAVPTVAAIFMTGAKPLYVDILEKDMTMDPGDAAGKITKKVKAIIPVHIYGYPCRMDEIMSLARKHNISVVEDACQSHGAKYRNRMTGTIGDIGCFSFYPTKNLGAYGDAGMVITKNKRLAMRIRALRQYGEVRKNCFVDRGINSRLSDIQAAVLRVKLRFLDKQNRKRRELAEIYKQELKDVPLEMPSDNSDMRHVYHLFVVRSKKRNKLKRFLLSNNIPTMIHYPYNLHLDKLYRAGNRRRLPNTEKVKQQILSLPLYADMAPEEGKKISGKICEFYSRFG